MATMRADERHFFATAKDDLEQGISAVQRHSSALRNYWGASFVQQLAQGSPGLTSDRDSANAELSAAAQYFAHLYDRCAKNDARSFPMEVMAQGSHFGSSHFHSNILCWLTQGEVCFGCLCLCVFFVAIPATVWCWCCSFFIGSRLVFQDG